MAIKTLKIKDLRNIKEASFSDLNQINVIFGKNASGKTSVLEAIYLLGLAKSFRSQSHIALINRDAEELVIHATLQDQTGIGVRKTLPSKSLYKINGKPAQSAADLAQNLPLQLINSDSFHLLSGGPGLRRSYLDKGVFHVEHGFLPTWRRAQKALKQRNTMLKRGRISYSELHPWDVELIENTEIIHGLRQLYIETLKQELSLLTREFANFGEALTIDYFAGWDQVNMSFEEALERAFRRDSVSGFSTVGPHRADIKIKIGGFPAIDVLSRGQQKTLVAMMQVAQGTGVYRATGQKPVFLVDDIGAELDAANGVKLLSMLADTGLQLFITAINPQDANLEGLSVNNPGWFHVEHGRVARV